MQFREPYFKAVTDNTVHQVKSGRIAIGGVLWHNDDTAARFMQVFNKASASVSLGTTAADVVLQLEADTTRFIPFGDAVFSTGFSFAVTTTRNGSTAGTASDVTVLYS